MNVVDIAILAVLLLSALAAFSRGFLPLRHGTATWAGDVYDLAAIGIAAACFAFAYLIFWALGRV